MPELEVSLQQFGDFLRRARRTDWHRQPASTAADAQGRVNQLAALEELRRRL